MPTPWLKRIKNTGQLTVFNGAGAWSSSVKSGIATFNTLGLGVKLVEETEERSANIVVKLSNGSDTYDHYGNSITVNFPAQQLHGRARTLIDERRFEIFFAAIFLPGRVPNPTLKQKEVIIVHELMHAAGLNGALSGGGKDPNDDHDSVGVMVSQMKVQGDGLIEYMPEKGVAPMTPIRVGSSTRCKLKMLWTADGCDAS